MEYGFIGVWGKAWCNAWVDTYNQYTREIVQRESRYTEKSGSLAKDEIEQLKDNRHKFFVMCCDMSKE
jgi:hypothetical protein